MQVYFSLCRNGSDANTNETHTHWSEFFLVGILCISCRPSSVIFKSCQHLLGVIEMDRRQGQTNISIIELVTM